MDGGGLNALPTVEADFAALERARIERDAKAKAKTAQLNKYIANIERSTNEKDFAGACDEMAVWTIGEGKLPEGIDPRMVRDYIQDTYESLPKKGYACEVTRTNKGVCFSPGPPADDAYNAVLKELRKYATKKFKGSLQSDGVSAANSAAF